MCQASNRRRFSFCIPSLLNTFIVLLIPLFAFSSTAAGADTPIDYARDVRPIFAKHCFRCHGPKEEEGGLRLDNRKRALEGGTSGPLAIVPGKAAESLVWQFITGRNEDKIVMPPKDQGSRLTAAQCEIIRRWIDAGAPWPED